MQGYLRSKARDYLRLGPERYGKQDALKRPDFEMDEELQASVESACEQIVEGRGFAEDQPLTGVSIQGLYAALHIFHWERVSQSAYEVEGGFFRDRIEFKHLLIPVDTVVLYNLVPMQLPEDVP